MKGNTTMETTTSGTSHGYVIEADNKNSSEIIQREKIEGTPFTAVNENGEWALTLGNYKLQKRYEDIQELKKQIKNPKWDEIEELIAIIAEVLIEFKNNNK